jgi:aarF domain-containing kinase
VSALHHFLEAYHQFDLRIDHGLYKEIDDDFRIKYAELWRSLMMADLKGIETACLGLGIDKAYPLFAALLTARPYDEIIERSKTGSFSAPCSAPESQADRAVIRGYAKQFLKDIFVLLGILPRQMLLLLKMNDCLRHIDFALGSPTNTLVVAGKYASKAVHEHQVKRSDATLSSRVVSWLGYVKVLFRIQIHDFGAWLIQNISSSDLLKHS